MTATSVVAKHGEPRFALTAAALLLVALGSCTADPSSGTATAPTPAIAAPAGATAPAGSGVATTPGAHAPSGYAPATGSGPPSKLQNMNAPQVVALLGEPAFKREENPAQVWRYTAKSCVLELFLYRLDKDLQVRHVEARDAKANPVAQEACIANVAAQKKTVASK